MLLGSVEPVHERNLQRTSRRAFTAVALWLASALASAASAQGSRLVPGLMGPNALPAIPVEDAELPSWIDGELALSFHATGPGNADRTFAPQFRVVVPFLGIAALELAGTPVEVWNVTPATRDRIEGRSLSGVAKGDLYFGARFALLGETGSRPALTLRLLTKTTTGKALVDRRFTNTPGYAIETLAAKTLREGSGTVRRVRLLAKLGFFSWSQEPGLQDDALDYGIALDARFSTGTELRVELRGYQGYEIHDKPMLVGLRFLQPLAPRVGLILGVNRGVRADAPAWELRTGIEFRLDSPFR